MKEKEGENAFIQSKRKLEVFLNKWQNGVIEHVKYMKEKHEKTIKEYAFILEDVIRIVCPVLLRELSA
jgi:hypothetical protein